MADSNNTQQTDKNKDVIFPFQVDIASKPERRWIRSERLWVRVCIFSLAVTAILATFFLVLTQYKKSTPVFLTFNNQTKTFERVSIQSEVDNASVVSKDTLAVQAFVSDYIIARNTLSTVRADNYQRWCDCLMDERQKLLIKKSLRRQTEPRCRVCLMSDKDVYQTFRSIQMPVFQKRIQNGDRRVVSISSITHMTTIPENRGGVYSIYRVAFKRTNSTLPHVGYWQAFVGVKKNNAEAISTEFYPYLYQVVSYSEAPLMHGDRP